MKEKTGKRRRIIKSYRRRCWMDNERIKIIMLTKGKPFRKLPIVIKAYQTEEGLIIKTLEGTFKANIGDWIIRGVNGEFYPCKPDIFRKTYCKMKKKKRTCVQCRYGWMARTETPRQCPLCKRMDWIRKGGDEKI